MSGSEDHIQSALTVLNDFAREDPLAAGLLALFDAERPDSLLDIEQPPSVEMVSEQHVLAALSDTFTWDEIREGRLTPEDPPASPLDDAAEANLFALCTPTLIAGRRRLRLLPQARAGILRHAQNQPGYPELLRRAVAQDELDFDAISVDAVRRPTAWLRSFLIDAYGDLARAPPSELEAAVTALEDLQGAELGSSVPTTADARRWLALAQLLEPLRMLVGASGGWEGRPGQDRFVGRETELTALRAFVDELQSTSVRESLGRGLQKAALTVAQATGFARPGLFRIQARGGLGKSTLMAKFVLDHALGQTRAFPFVYFDFDRASLQPREPRRLLAESVRQLGLQFPDMTQACEQLLGKMEHAEAGQGDLDFDPFEGFGDLIRLATDHGRRAFLLILDTMEVVQYDPHALAGVLAFLRALTTMPQLRVVAAGRAGMQVLEQALNPDPGISRERVLGPFSMPEAVQMANTLGGALVGAAWNPVWAARIVGPTGGAPERREPLALRVAVELLRDPSVDRDALAEDISRSGEAADDSFVARLYERRVLDHVQDPEVRAIAWPGLVVRRVTVEIVRDLLAEPCGIDPARAEAVFEKLAREVWIVDRDGDGLIHRRDLRARSLPLMRRKDPERFDAINTAAVRWFASRAPASPASRAEWIYHRLLAGEDVAAVDSDFTADLVGPLSKAIEDFGRDTLVGQFLSVRTATRLMSPRRIERLESWLALEHLARTAPELGSLTDTAIVPVVEDVSARAARHNRLSPPAARMAEILRVRTGRWRDVDLQRLALDASEDERANFTSAYVQVRSNWSSLIPWDLPADSASQSVRAMAQALAAARLADSPLAVFIDVKLLELLEQFATGAEVTDPITLRTVATFGKLSAGPAARAWVIATRLGPADAAFSLAELRAWGGSTGRPFDEVVAPQLMRLGAHVNIQDRGAPPMRIGDPAVTRAVLRLMQEQLSGDGDSRALRRFFAARNEDWIVPLAYAAKRALPKEIPRALFERLERYSVLDPTAERREGRRIARITGDLVTLLRRADEAGDLAGMCKEILASAHTESGDFAHLVQLQGAWRQGIETCLARIW